MFLLNPHLSVLRFPPSHNIALLFSQSLVHVSCWNAFSRWPYILAVCGVVHSAIRFPLGQIVVRKDQT